MSGDGRRRRRSIDFSCGAGFNAFRSFDGLSFRVNDASRSSDMPLDLEARERSCALSSGRRHRHRIRSHQICLQHLSLCLSLFLPLATTSILTRTAEASAIPSSAGRRTRPDPADGCEEARKRAGRGSSGLDGLVVLGDDGGDIREFDFFLFGSHFKKKKLAR